MQCVRAFILGLIWLGLAAAPVAAGDGAVTLPGYDCTATTGLPSRDVAQVIAGQAHMWREYLPLGGDAAAAPVCLEKLKPDAGRLTKGAAEAFLAGSMAPAARPCRPTASGQAGPPCRRM